MDLRPFQDDADGTGDGIAARHNMVGAKARNVGGGGGNRAKLRHNRLFLGELAQALVQRFTAGRRAARAIHEHNDAGDVVGLGDVLQHFKLAAVLGDGAFQRKARDLLLAGQRRQFVAAKSRCTDSQSNGCDAGTPPKRQRAAQAAPVQHCFSFKHDGPHFHS